jgi:hypothetical protein
MQDSEFTGMAKTFISVDQQEIYAALDALRIAEHYINASLKEIDDKKVDFYNSHLIKQLRNQIVKDVISVQKAISSLSK